jgi:hypothetical protein
VHLAICADTYSFLFYPTLRQLVNAAIDFKPCTVPQPSSIAGEHCSLLPVNSASIKLHGAALYSFYCEEQDKTWTYLPYGPFDSCDSYLSWLLSLSERREGLTNDAIPYPPPQAPAFIAADACISDSLSWWVALLREFVPICVLFHRSAALKSAMLLLRRLCVAPQRRRKRSGNQTPPLRAIERSRYNS